MPQKPVAGPAKLVQIEKAVYGGNFLARIEGKATFVPLVLPGETARVSIIEGRRGYSNADLDEIVEPAPERVVPHCRHFGTCGGCQYQQTNYGTQLALKKAILHETLQRGGVNASFDIDVLAGSEEESWGYRNRIRLAFDASGNPGYRGRRSKAIVPIAECPIAAPLLVRSALAFAETERQITPQIPVSEFSLFCDSTESTLLALIYLRGRTGEFDALTRALAERIPELKGIAFVLGARDEDSEEGTGIVERSGEPSLLYRAAGFDYRVDNGAFFQVNRRLVDPLVKLVTDGQSGTLAWDLFAGVGLFARKLTGSFERVVAVESSPLALFGLKANLKGTCGSAVQSSTSNFLRGPANKEKPDLIVIDPPRAGLGPDVTTSLAAVGAGLVTYVSCDPATLARDLRFLLLSGYAIDRATLVDLFPQTFHLETVVYLRRS